MISVVGDIILDEYIYTKKTRQSPEQPTADVLLVKKKEYYLGGAANVAVNLSKLNKVPILITSIGKDEYSDTLTRLLYKNKIAVYNSCNKNNSNIVKTRVFNNDEYVVRIDYENLIDCDQDSIIEFVNCKKTPYLIISDYNKGTITKPKDIISSTKAKVLVDPKKPFEEYDGAYLLKANQTEFEQWYGKELTTETQLTKAVKDLNIDVVIVTLGDKGCFFDSKTFKARGYIRSPYVDVVSVVGAGDSFIAGLAYGLSNNQLLPDALVTANKVASVSVTKKGTSYVRESEIIGSSK
jgi:rfaE bifunctional protein kinase chain/domain